MASRNTARRRGGGACRVNATGRHVSSQRDRAARRARRQRMDASERGKSPLHALKYMWKICCRTHSSGAPRHRAILRILDSALAVATVRRTDHSSGSSTPHSLRRLSPRAPFVRVEAGRGAHVLHARKMHRAALTWAAPSAVRRRPHRETETDWRMICATRMPSTAALTIPPA